MKRLLALALLGCHASSSTPVTTTPTPPAAAPIKPSAEVRSFNSKAPPVHSEWLVLTLPSAKAAATITAKLEKQAVESAREFIEMTRKVKADRDDPQMLSPDSWDMSRTCRATMLAPSLVSVRCEEYQYSGGVHGMNVSLGQTWSITGDTVRELALGDLFVEPWLPTVDGTILASLRKQEATWVVEGSLTSVAELLHTWNVTKDGVLFAFNPYEVGPYVQGTMEALVGWNALAKIRKSPGPLDSVAPGS